MRVHQHGLSLRNFRRLFGDKLRRDLQNAGYTCWYSEGDAQTFALCIVAHVADPENGLRSVTYAFRLAKQTLSAACFFQITHHAIARCLQRNGTIKLTDIQTDLRVASGLSWAFLILARQNGWRQVAVPTPSGLFLGEYSEKHGLVLRTFVRPGENGRASRWCRLLESLRGMPVPGDLRSEEDASAYIDRCNLWLVGNCTRLGVELSFLRQPHVATADPLDEAWTARGRLALAAA